MRGSPRPNPTAPPINRAPPRSTASTSQPVNSTMPMPAAAIETRMMNAVVSSFHLTLGVASELPQKLQY
jgi:hypothetical protein